MSLSTDAMEVLEKTSRTFFIPISRLPSGLIDAVASGYLCMRAIDEIEDHPVMQNREKSALLHSISLELQSAVMGYSFSEFPVIFAPYVGLLPEVTYRINDWTQIAPKSIAPRIFDAIATMADRMAYWADNQWRIRTRSDLDRYTFGVAGAVGLMLSDLWAWYDDTKTNRDYAIGFGRGLQAVNILRNRADDLSRGVDFFPNGWGDEQLQAYARLNLSLADAYISELYAGPALDFCNIPLVLAHATLDALARGEEKLSRTAVMELTAQRVG